VSLRYMLLLIEDIVELRGLSLSPECIFS